MKEGTPNPLPSTLKSCSMWGRTNTITPAPSFIIAVAEVVPEEEGEEQTTRDTTASSMNAISFPTTLTPRDDAILPSQEITFPVQVPMSLPLPSTPCVPINTQEKTPSYSNTHPLTQLPLDIRLEIYSYAGWELEDVTCAYTHHPILLAWFGATKVGDLQVLKQMESQLVPMKCVRFQKTWRNLCWRPEFCRLLARAGYHKCLVWARENKCPWNYTCTAAAAAGGHLALLQWLREEGCPISCYTVCAAANGGSLEILQWLQSCGYPLEGPVACEAAVKGGHLKILQWLRSQKCDWDKRTIDAAKLGGHNEIVEWLQKQRRPGRSYTVSLRSSSSVSYRTCRKRKLP